MSTRTLRFSGDYKIDSNGNIDILSSVDGNIVLNTRSNGTVTVIGNLVVQGASTTVTSTDLSITDNIITLNKDESGAGVTLGISGLVIDRGSLTPAAILWDESTDQWKVYNDSNATLGDFRSASISLTDGETVTSIDNDTTLSGDSSQILATQHAVKTYVDNNIVTNAIYQNNSSVVITDVGVSGSYVEFNLDGVLYAKLQSEGFRVDNISSLTSDGNLTISGNGTGQVILSNAIRMVNQVSTPSTVGGSNQFYAATPGTGKTGLYVNNSIVNDELVSKSRALLFSLIL